MPGSPEIELAALRESEERFRVLSDACRDALFLEDEGIIREANHACALLLDYERSELVGRAALEFVAPESQFDFLECASRSNWASDVTVLSRGGAHRTVEVSSAPVTYRGRAMRAVTLRDRPPNVDPGTGRPSEVRLHAALEAAGLGIWDYDPATGRITWSPPARPIFGSAFVERGATPEAFMAQLHPEDRERIETSIQACLRGEQNHFQAEYRVVGADGVLRWVESSGQVFRAPDGAALRMVGVVADVTQRHEFAAQLLHSQRLEATGRLAGSVAFADSQSGTFSTALPLAAEPKKSLTLNQVVSNRDFFTGIALVNPGSADGQAQIRLLDKAGNELYSRSVAVKAMGRSLGLLTEYFPELIGQDINSGYLQVSSENGLVACEVLGTHNLTALSAIPARGK